MSDDQLRELIATQAGKQSVALILQTNRYALIAGSLPAPAYLATAAPLVFARY